MSAPTLAAARIVVLLAVNARGAKFHRRFEPTDLELERPGYLETDMQFGITSGDFGAGRLYLPDYEVDLGLTSRVELDLDGSFALDPLKQTPTFKTGEPLWTSVKIGLFDVEDAGPARVAAAGLQLGPRLTINSDGTLGSGYGALALGRLDFGAERVVVNAGALLDEVSPRVFELGLVLGLDLAVDLDSRGRWSLTGEAGITHYLPAFPDQLAFTWGVAYDTGDASYSIATLVSPIGISDRAALLLGWSPRVRAF